MGVLGEIAGRCVQVLGGYYEAAEVMFGSCTVDYRGLI